MKVRKISVVSVCLNVSDCIRLTLESVFNQTFQNIEHIIIDGGSKDGTQNIVQEYPLGYFISEPDEGVYHAMQKGAAAAKGDILIFLNAGDTFYEKNTCEKVAHFFEETKADIVFGNLLPVYLNSSDSHDHGAFISGKLIDLSYMQNRRQFFDESIHHQATFYRRWIFNKCSYISVESEANGEYNLLLNAVMKHRAKVKHIPQPISRFILGGISTRNFEVEWKKYITARNILRKLYFPNPQLIKSISEREFCYDKTLKQLVSKISTKHRLKHIIKRSYIFSIYNRLATGFSARVINVLIAKIEDFQEIQSQRIFNDLNYAIEKKFQDYLTRINLTLNQHDSISTTILKEATAFRQETLNETRNSRQETAIIEHKMNESLNNLSNSLNTLCESFHNMNDFVRCGAILSERNNNDLRRMITLGNIGVAKLYSGRNNTEDFSSHGFRIYSQWDEDGLIQYLISHLEIPEQVFVEIGVGDYSEANTRLLMEMNNWSGYLIDCNQDNIEKIQSSEFYWRYNINAINAFVSRENINAIFLENNIPSVIGVLSIDVDGVDYWIWEAIDVVSPKIVICEYNGIFGSDAKVTVPYEADFDRTKKHYSWLYAGAALRALEYLGKKKGYTLLGTNNGGNNAFFVRDDVLNQSNIHPPEVFPYKKPLFKESRNEDGSLSYLDIAEGLKVIKEMEVYNIDTNLMTKINKLNITLI